MDAAAVVDLLVRSERGQRVAAWLGERPRGLATVAHLDAEVFSALARLHRAGSLGPEEVRDLLHRLADLAVERLPVTGELLGAAWDLRDNVSARDALYVAAAVALGGQLLTTDDALARACDALTVGVEVV